MIDRIIFVAYVVCLLVVRVASQQSDKPNIVIILSDDQGFADAGFQGSTQIHTPKLDWLAQRSTLLTRHYAQPMCTPSRAALLTGYYPIKTGMQHGVVNPPRPFGLPLQFNTMPGIFREFAGYATHLVGKWHLGFFKREYTPTYRGFDSFLGYYGGMDGYFTHTNQRDEMFGVDWHEDTGPELRNAGGWFGEYGDNVIGDRACEIVLAHDTQRPLFLQLSFQGPHTPNEAESSYNRRFPHIWTWERRQYAMQLAALDHNVGNLIQALQSRGMFENTYLLFSSDNGGISGDGDPTEQGSNYPLRGTKTTLFEGGVRVPAFIRGPGIPQQVNYDSYVHITDWLPTLYTAIGGNVSDLGPIDGVDQFDALRGNVREGPRTEFLLNIDPVTGDSGIVSGQYKLYSSKSGLGSHDGWYFDSGPFGQNNTYRVPSIGSWELHLVTCNSTEQLGATCDLQAANSLCLFDIINDPCEYDNIAGRHPEVVAELVGKLAEYESQMVPPGFAPVDSEADPALHGGFWGPWM